MTQENELYTKHADLYAAIADDRDFSRELSMMTPRGDGALATFVELFAGPAFHATRLCEAGTTAQIVAVDCSPAMEAVARTRGFSGEYRCSDALTAMRQVQEADVVCIARFSIVLVPKPYLSKLFSEISRALSADGVLYLEIHAPEVADFKDPTVAADWSRLPIHRRVRHVDGATVECVWPDSVHLIDPTQAVVEMTVKITTTTGGHTHVEQVFYSREYLHTVEDLSSIAAQVGLTAIPSRGFITPTGRYLAFGRADCSRPPAAQPGDPGTGTRLTHLAQSRLFDLSTHASRDALLELSGLQMDSHDSPLSLHVYNLL